MEQFIDITGASGAVYRFRPVGQPAQLPATAGNFLLLNPLAATDEIVCCGTALSLVDAAPTWKTAHHAGPMFVRLNVFRAVRLSEHDDIVENYRPSVVVSELDGVQSSTDLSASAAFAVRADEPSVSNSMRG